MKYADLRELRRRSWRRPGELKRIARRSLAAARDDRDLRPRAASAGGPALLFEKPKGHDDPGARAISSARRAASRSAWGARSVEALRELGQLLALSEGARAAERAARRLGQAAAVEAGAQHGAAQVRSARRARKSCGKATTSISARLPIQTCWPGDAGPLITWGLTVTRGPQKTRQNLGIYRQQVIGRNKLIMRWLAHRGGALDFRDHCSRIRASRFRWRSRSAPTRRPCSAR